MKTENTFFRSFKLLGVAARNCRSQIWQSIMVLMVITIVLAAIFWAAEGQSNPKEYGNLIRDIGWAFCVYIQDPGGLAGSGPSTTIGKLVATALGYINILIVAVPAGIIGGGFTQALDEDKQEREASENAEKLRHSFRRVQCRHTFRMVVPRYKSLMSLQIEQEMSDDDIIMAVKKADDMRLSNLSDIYYSDEEAKDRLVVELFPRNVAEATATSFGCAIDRGSNVTIVATSGEQELGDSNFAYYLALYGGFNYVSKEGDELKTAPQSYYNLQAETEKTERYQAFLSTLQGLSKSEDSWFVFILNTPRRMDTQFHFVTRTKNSEKGTTIMNDERFQSMFDLFSQSLETKNYPLHKSERESAKPLSVDLDRNINPTGERCICRKIGGGISTNAFTIRIDSHFLVGDNRNIAIAARLAEIMHDKFDAKHPIDDSEWKQRGYGFANQTNE